MKSKDYDKKRKELRQEKREGMKEDFVDTKSRKRFVDGIKRSYRSLKRSEKQTIYLGMEEEIEIEKEIEKQIEEAQYNEDDF